jgi:mitochondrial import inner membrane translocase subunit TIM23
MATLLCPRATCLRQFSLTTRTLAAPKPAKAAFSTQPTAAFRQLRTSTQSRPSIVCRIPPSPVLSAVAIRFSSAATSPTPGRPGSSTPPSEILTWNRFFDLRRRRRYINLGASILTAFVAVSFGAPVLAQQDIDSWGAQLSGLDPMIVLGISTFAIAAGGWLCGPSIGNLGFGFWARSKGWGQAIMEVR